MFCDRVILAALGVGSLLACERTPSPAESGVVDDAGRGVQLTEPAQRIVSLSPATTEALFAIGAGDRVIGRTQWGEDPPDAQRVPSVGNGLDPNIEVVLARRPDLVVFYHSASNAEAIQRLDDLGVASASFRVDRLDDLRRAARRLGELTGQQAAADSLIGVLDTELAELAGAPTLARSSVLILVWDNPPIVIGSGSFLSEIVQLAGGRNVFEDLPQPSATVAVEAIAQRDPDVVLITGGAQPAFAERPEWQVVKAVRERRFVMVQGSEFGRPSFRAPQAIRKLRSALREWAQ